MKTTNLVVDFVIIGFIAVLGILAPFAMVWPQSFEVFLTAKAEILLKLTPALTVAVYILGVLFNQVADRIDGVWHAAICFLRRPKSLLRWRNEKRELQDSEHRMVQAVVLKSASAYDYLSYRRSLMRVFRALAAASIGSLALYLLLILRIGLIPSEQLDPSGTNLVIVLSLIALWWFSSYTSLRLESGYLRAARQFETTSCP